MPSSGPAIISIAPSNPGGPLKAGVNGTNITQIRIIPKALSGGTTGTVLDTLITTSSFIIPTSNSNAVVGALRVSAQDIGSYVISSSASDNGPINVFILDP